MYIVTEMMGHKVKDSDASDNKCDTSMTVNVVQRCVNRQSLSDHLTA